MQLQPILCFRQLWYTLLVYSHSATKLLNMRNWPENPQRTRDDERFHRLDTQRWETYPRLIRFRFSHRVREDESQRHSLHRGPDVLPGHTDQNQSESPIQSYTPSRTIHYCLVFVHGFSKNMNRPKEDARVKASTVKIQPYCLRCPAQGGWGGREIINAAGYFPVTVYRSVFNPLIGSWYYWTSTKQRSRTSHFRHRSF